MTTEHLRIKLTNGLPQRIERIGDYRSAFLIPKARRLEVLQFIKEQPQHIVKQTKSVIEVLGIMPAEKIGGGGNAHRDFITLLRGVLRHMPQHELAKLSLIDLKTHPKVRALYDQIKDHPELLTEESVMNLVKSQLLNYSEETGQVREGVSDIRMKRQLPSVPTAAPSLQIRQESEFDRILLLVFGRFLAANHIPEAFLKSAYFTARIQLQQLFTEDAHSFRARVEDQQAEDDIRRAIVNDYKAMTNTVNQQYLSRYPFEVVSNAVIDFQDNSYRLGRRKLGDILQHALAVPGSQQKFDDLATMLETYRRSLESKLIHYDNHFMIGLRQLMTSDADFVRVVLRNGSRHTAKVINTLNGQSM